MALPTKAIFLGLPVYNIVDYLISNFFDLLVIYLCFFVLQDSSDSGLMVAGLSFKTIVDFIQTNNEVGLR